MIGLIRALRIIRESASLKNKETLNNFIEYLWEKIKPEEKVDFERNWLENEKEKLNRD